MSLIMYNFAGQMTRVDAEKFPNFGNKVVIFMWKLSFQFEKTLRGYDQLGFFGAVPSSGEDGASHHFMGF